MSPSLRKDLIAIAKVWVACVIVLVIVYALAGKL